MAPGLIFHGETLSTVISKVLADLGELDPQRGRAYKLSFVTASGDFFSFFSNIYRRVGSLEHSLHWFIPIHSTP